MRPILVDRNLAAASLVLLAVTGAAVLIGSSSRGNAFLLWPYACFPEPPDPRDQPASAATADGAQPSAAGERRLDDDRVIAALRRVIQDHGVATLLHYPCGDMAWAGPVVTAVQVWGRGSIRPAYVVAHAGPRFGLSRCLSAAHERGVRAWVDVHVFEGGMLCLVLLSSANVHSRDADRRRALVQVSSYAT